MAPNVKPKIGDIYKDGPTKKLGEPGTGKVTGVREMPGAAAAKKAEKDYIARLQSGDTSRTYFTSRGKSPGVLAAEKKARDKQQQAADKPRLSLAQQAAAARTTDQISKLSPDQQSILTNTATQLKMSPENAWNFINSIGGVGRLFELQQGPDADDELEDWGDEDARPYSELSDQDRSNLTGSNIQNILTSIFGAPGMGASTGRNISTGIGMGGSGASSSDIEADRNLAGTIAGGPGPQTSTYSGTGTPPQIPGGMQQPFGEGGADPRLSQFMNLFGDDLTEDRINDLRNIFALLQGFSSGLPQSTGSKMAQVRYGGG